MYQSPSDGRKTEMSVVPFAVEVGDWRLRRSSGRHGDGDRLAVGGGAVGDAHVEGVRADLGAARRPAEGAPVVIEAPAGTDPEVPLASEKVSVSPASGSLAVAVKASSLPAVAFLLPIGFRVGGVLAAATVTVIVSQSEAAPSETHTSKVCEPTWAPLGVQLKAPRDDRGARGHRPEVPLASEKVSVSPASGSLAVAVKASSLPAVAFLLPIGFRVGGVLAAATVTVIVSQSEADAVRDAHVEGVRADLAGGRRPAEGAPRDDRGAHGHRPEVPLRARR